MAQSNGFRHPLGNGFLTEAHWIDQIYDVNNGGPGPAPDGVRDGYYIATEHGSYEAAFSSYHLGEDWNGDDYSDAGDDVFAISNGHVDQVGYLNGLGNYVTIVHDLPYQITINGIPTSTIVSLYAHLANDVFGNDYDHGGARVSSGSIVTIGDHIGDIGQTGGTTADHLHFEIRLGTQYQDAGGYENPLPNGWVDPTDFINDHRTLTPEPDGPDLTADDVYVADTSLAVGDSTTVTFDLHNIGDMDANGFDAGIYLSSNSTITTGDILLNGVTGYTLPAGYFINNYSITITIPAGTAAGTWYIGVIADDLGDIDESNEGNNDSSPVAITIEASGLDGPTANDDTLTAYIGEIISGQTFTNDSANGGTLYVTHVNGEDALANAGDHQTTAGGTVTLIPTNGAYQYIAPQNSSATSDSFTYTVTNGNGSSDTATVYITLRPATEGRDVIHLDDGVSGISGNSRGVFYLRGGNDEFVGTANYSETVYAGAGADYIYTRGGNDRVYGESGNDTIVAGAGAGDDYYNGGADIDTVTYTSTSQGIIVNLTSGQATGSEIDTDTLVDIENVVGGAGWDSLIGNAAANSLTGGAGNDSLNGGAGADSAVFSGTRAQYTIIYNTNSTVTIAHNGGAGVDGTDTLTDIENAVFTDQTVSLAGNGNSAPTDIISVGNSVVENATAGTVVSTLSAVDADAGDTHTFAIIGNLSPFEIVGNQVRVRAGAIVDFETATSHNLMIEVTDAAGAIYSETVTIAVTNVNEIPTDITHKVGDDSDETITGDAGDDYIEGKGGADNINGGDGSDWLYGQDGDDVINAGDGAMDVSIGGAGDDTINGEGGMDYMFGGAGNDTARGGDGDDVAYGGDGNDNLYGDDGADWLFGEAGNDKLFGGAGADLLMGGAGTDEITGGAGNDWMWGGDMTGAGDGVADTFFFGANWGGDVIWDFEDGSDMLDVSGAGITSFGDLTIGTFGQFTTITSATGDIIYLRGAGDVAIAEANIGAADFLL